MLPHGNNFSGFFFPKLMNETTSSFGDTSNTADIASGVGGISYCPLKNLPINYANHIENLLNATF